MLRPAGLRLLELVLASAIALGGARTAAADDTVTKADALFAEGVKLRDSNLELACAKFGESLQLNPQAIGVLLNVAMCDEQHGRIASAVRRYRETRERAVEQSFPEYLKAADAKLAALTPDVPLLTIRFEKPPAQQTKVVVDDQVVPLSALEQVPLDPGERVIVVSAPGRIPFQRRISIAKRERRELAVPPLEKPSPRRTIGKISAAAGGAALVTGIVLGYVANRRYDEQIAGPGCQPGANGEPPICDGKAYAAIRSARQLGNVGTVVGGAGAAVMLAGGYLWFFAPKPYAERRGVAVVPRVAPDGGGVAVVGRF
jgi:hypothetical protein